MPEKSKKLTVFLSHAHDDIDKVRDVRDVLETLNCEPITFFLACMNDNDPLLEKLIQDEIDARHVFVYCRSKKAEKSKWVQKELDYIRSNPERRVYEIDLEENFESSIVRLLNELMEIIYSNTVVLCYGKSAGDVVKPLKKRLADRGFAILEYDPAKSNAAIKKAAHYCGSGIFVPIFYQTKETGKRGWRPWSSTPPVCQPAHDSGWDNSRTEMALQEARQNEEARVLPVYVDAQQGERYSQCSPEGCYLSENMLAEGVYQIVEAIESLSRDSKARCKK